MLICCEATDHVPKAANDIWNCKRKWMVQDCPMKSDQLKKKKDS